VQRKPRWYTRTDGRTAWRIWQKLCFSRQCAHAYKSDKNWNFKHKRITDYRQRSVWRLSKICNPTIQPKRIQNWNINISRQIRSFIAAHRSTPPAKCNVSRNNRFKNITSSYTSCHKNESSWTVILFYKVCNLSLNWPLWEDRSLKKITLAGPHAKVSLWSSILHNCGEKTSRGFWSCDCVPTCC
jgi:hypothetical protein